MTPTERVGAIILLHFTGSPVPITARVHSTPQITIQDTLVDVYLAQAGEPLAGHARARALGVHPHAVEVARVAEVLRHRDAVLDV
eukprot:1177099-Prorocentrum_minimum.AAC.1